MAVLRTLAAWAFTAVYWTAVFALYLATFRRLPPAFAQAAIRFWGRSALAITGVRLELANASTFEERAARVVVYNHTSALDMLWTAALCPPAPLAVGKKEVVWVPFVNLAWWAFGFIRVDRSNPIQAARSIEGVAESVLSDRRSYCLAPEGTRSLDGKLLPFKKGAFVVAIRSQAPVCAMVAEGAQPLLPKGCVVIRPGVIRVRFLPTFETRGLREGDARGLADRVRQAMADALSS
ncbi:MAG: 1-acyl-sn-glycerol-3-phosphate acyltransferase [Elusimicrobia bacterium]|nr:1-acyl-sn-glycerol-3-phosphate acyltransferase [Elusimicrobiota bacterium]